MRFHVTATCLLALMGGQQAIAQDSITLDTIILQSKGAQSGPAGAALNTVVDQDALESRAPRNLREVFRRSPSVSVGGGSAASQKIYVHGFEESKLAVTVDGARLPGNIWHHNGSSTIDPALLARVEVEPGVAPADAGFASGIGSLRFSTVWPDDLLQDGRDHGGRAAMSYSDNGNTVTGSLTGFGRSGGFEYLGMVSRSSGDDYDNGEGKREIGTGADLFSALLKLAYETEDGHRFSISHEHVEDDAERLLRLNMGLIGTPLLQKNASRRDTTTLRYALTQTSEVWAPEVEFYNTDASLERPQRNSSRPLPGGGTLTYPNGDFNADTQIRGGKLQNTFTLTNSTITAGVDFYDRKIGIERFYANNPRGVALKGGKGWVHERAHGLGAFVQWRADLTDQLKLSSGLRFDTQDYDAVDGSNHDNSGASQNLTISYEITPEVTVFAGAGRSWLGLEQGEPALFHAYDYVYPSDLEPAVADNFQIGANYTTGEIELAASLFRTNLKDSFAFSQTTSPATRTNAGTITSEGIDLALTYHFDQGRTGMRLSHTDIDFGSNTGSGSNELVNLTMPMGTQVTLFADYQLSDYNTTVGADIEIAAKYDDADFLARGFLPLDSYKVVNVYAEWTPPALQGAALRIGVSNLFDESYSERGTYPGSNNPQAPVNSVQAEGRNITLSARMAF